MPRQPRLDVPGALHHVVGRGIERGKIFIGIKDREDFLVRLSALVEEGNLLVYAWALMPNHFHLLVRTTKTSLSMSMRKLMSGYAGYFNREHKRSGHVFQNRFTSILCEEDSYFLELVRYIHLNPVRSSMLTLEALGDSPLTGHAVLIGKMACPWQDTEEVLSRFSGMKGKRLDGYIQFVEEGFKKAEPKHLEGGGLVRSNGGWQLVRDLRWGRERYASDERVLGGSEFVESLLKEAEREMDERAALRRKWEIERLMRAVCDNVGVGPEQLGGAGKSWAVAKARQGLCYLWVKKLGGSGGELARAAGMKQVTVYKAANKGQSNFKEWESILG